jgi:hypothetical protein
MVDIIPIDQIVSKIYWLRGTKVMLDRDLATLYEVETRILKRNVRRQSKGANPTLGFVPAKISAFLRWRSILY